MIFTFCSNENIEVQKCSPSFPYCLRTNNTTVIIADLWQNSLRSTAFQDIIIE